MDAPRPYLSSYADRHGKTRWRFRRGKITRSLPGHPGEDRFERAYDDALNGRKHQAAVVRHPNHALPGTLKAAWRLAVARDNMDWQQLSPASREQYIARAERFLAMEIVPGRTYADAPVADIRRRHVKALLGSMADRPHAGSDVLVVLRKMITVALDHEWIEVDPTHRLGYRPEIDGHRAWTDDERASFEARWPLGTMARTVYACALYSGQRRSDLVRIRWSDFDGDRLPLVQQKTGKRLVLPVLPAWREALGAAPRHGDTVLATVHGGQRSLKGLTVDFQDWAEAAGLKGCTLHGLRKTLGKIIAEAGGTTRELMGALGHETLAHAELYSRDAEQEALARTALSKAGARLRPRLRVVGGEPAGEPPGRPGPKRLK